MIVFLPLILLVFVSLVSTQGCGAKESEEETSRATETHTMEVAEYTKAIEEFGRINNADWNWQRPLKEHRLSTMNVQKALIRSDSRPIAALVDVFDIKQEVNSYRLRLHVPGLGTVFSKDQVFLDLTCSLGEKELEEIQKHLDSHDRDFMRFNPFNVPQFIVAAQIQEVQSHHQSVHLADGSRKESIEFAATGKCIQFKFQRKPPMPKSVEPSFLERIIPKKVKKPE